jgi:hypothetical protein
MSDIQSILEKVINLINAALEDNVNSFSVQNQDKLEGVVEDLLDIVQDLDMSIEEEYHVIPDINQLMMEIIELEEETW